MTKIKQKRRFIAGAICPRCSEMDRLVVYTDDNNDDYRQCVSCDFKEKMQLSSPAVELDTRVNVTPERVAAETSVVKIIK